ncbi:MAG TPA: riboflavin biosynthesis protein RibD, partial [Deltaproteobacteria bacterium]|nr:riboflavin biosynthesis protein RibD [Deltaproteobacteria bacterium]
DQLELFLAPKIIGGQDSLSWCGDLNVGTVNEASQLEISSITELGVDLLISAKLK